MKKICHVTHFLAALQFLTVIPVKRQTTADEIGKSQPWFPVAGLLIGAGASVCYLVAWMTGLPLIVASLLAVIALSGFAGFLHVDGVADTADGFFSSRPREQILEIMRDSRIGTMGVVGIFSIFALKWAALSTLAPGLAWRVLIVAPIIGRFAQVTSITLLPYARNQGGLVSAFIENRSNQYAAIAFGITFGAAIILCGPKGILALLATVVVCVLFSRWCLVKICGITGDTLGAVTELAEAVFICAMCAGAGGIQ